MDRFVQVLLGKLIELCSSLFYSEASATSEGTRSLDERHATHVV